MTKVTNAALQRQVQTLDDRIHALEAELDRLRQTSATASSDTQLMPGSADHGAGSGVGLGAMIAPTDESLESVAMARERRMVDALEAQQPPQFYKDFLAAVSRRINTSSYYTWFVGTRLSADDGRELTIRTDDETQAQWLRTRYRGVVEEAFAEIGRPGVAVRFEARMRWSL